MSKNSDPNFPSRSPPFPATTSIFVSPRLRMIIFQNDADNVGIFVHNGSIRINQPNGSFTYATSLENRKRDAVHPFSRFITSYFNITGESGIDASYVSSSSSSRERERRTWFDIDIGKETGFWKEREERKNKRAQKQRLGE